MFKKLPESTRILFFVIVGCVMVILFWFFLDLDRGWRISLACTRIDVGANCDVRRSWLGLIASKAEVDSLSSLRSAEFQKVCDKTCAYHVHLLARNDELTVPALSGESEKVSQLNAFLDGRLEVRTLDVSFGGSWIDVAGFALFTVGLVIAACIPFVFDGGYTRHY